MIDRQKDIEVGKQIDSRKIERQNDREMGWSIDRQKAIEKGRQIDTMERQRDSQIEKIDKWVDR